MGCQVFLCGEAGVEFQVILLGKTGFGISGNVVWGYWCVLEGIVCGEIVVVL